MNSPVARFRASERSEFELMRAAIETALKGAMLTQDKVRMSTLRLMLAAMRDRDLTARTMAAPR